MPANPAQDSHYLSTPFPLIISHQHFRPKEIRQIVFHNWLTPGLHLGSNLFDVSPNAEDVAANDLGGVSIGHPTAQQLSDEVRILGDIVKALGRLLDAVEVAAEPHVVVSDQVPDVRDVVGDLG